jgi:hypothetical protein
MDDSNEAVVDVRLGAERVRIRLVFDGPDGSPSQQSVRRALVSQTNFCGLDDLSSGPLQDVMNRASTRVALVSLAIDDTSPTAMAALPPAIVALLARGPRRHVRANASRAVAMYAFDAQQPCVLSYICVTPEARFLHIGSVVLEHYERSVVGTYGCELLYLASVDRAITFYERAGYTRVPGEYRGVLTLLDGSTIRLVDEKLMYKRVRREPQPSVEPAHAEVLDDDDSDVEVLDVVYRRRSGLPNQASINRARDAFRRARAGGGDDVLV